MEKQNLYRTDLGLVADKDHITKIAPKAKLIRVPSARYKFRISNLSSTVTKERTPVSLGRKIMGLYLLLFETHLVKRFFLKILYNKTYWKLEIEPGLGDKY